MNLSEKWRDFQKSQAVPHEPEPRQAEGSDWIIYVDPDTGADAYVTPRTGETTWHCPEELKIVQAQENEAESARQEILALRNQLTQFEVICADGTDAHTDALLMHRWTP